MTRGDLTIGTATGVVLLATALRCTSLFQGPTGIAIAATPAPQRALEIAASPPPHAPAALQRALFARSAPEVREAATKAPDMNSNASNSLQAPRLLGVIIEGANRVAVVSVGGQVSRIRENSTVGPWTVKRIDERSAHVYSAIRSEVLWLDKPRP